MNNAKFIALFIFTFSAYADPYSDFQMDVPCYGVDGVPLIGARAAKCCSDGKNTGTGSECSSGFVSMSLDTQYTLAAYAQIAMNSLQSANESIGTGANFEMLEGAVENIGIIKPIGAAMNSGSGPKESGSGLSANIGKDLGQSAEEAASSGNGSGGAGGGLGIGSASGTSGKSNGAGTSELLASKEGSAAGGYATGEGGAGAQGSGSGGAGTGVSVDAFGQQEFKSGSENEMNAGNEEESSGSATDPADYFNRIDKSANIFKIVSNRYGTKKSLWKPQEVVKTGIVPVIKR